MVRSKWKLIYLSIHIVFWSSIWLTCFVVTEEIIRKRSEHNEGEISTLEEIALHQEDIEKIEHIQNWCRDLQILLLQSNIIAKIGNYTYIHSTYFCEINLHWCYYMVLLLLPIGLYIYVYIFRTCTPT